MICTRHYYEQYLSVAARDILQPAWKPSFVYVLSSRIHSPALLKSMFRGISFFLNSFAKFRTELQSHTSPYILMKHSGHGQLCDVLDVETYFGAD